MKKVLMLVMVLCVGLTTIPAGADVYYELWDGLVPPRGTSPEGLEALDWENMGPPSAAATDSKPAMGIIPNFNEDFRAGTDRFTFRQRAVLQVDVTGNYAFWVATDDGGIILVDGIRVAHWHGWHGSGNPGRSGEDQTTPVFFPLTAGYHIIEAQMFEDGGGEELRVRYESADAGIARDFIPDAKLTPLATPVNPANWAIDVPLSGTVLEWTNPHGAAAYDVYFGDSPLVGDPNEGATYLIGQVAGTTADLDTLYGALTSDTTYYWRVDAVAAPNTIPGIAYRFDSMRMNPIITGQPQSVGVGPGGCLGTFTVTAISGINDDGGALSFQWKDDTGADIVGETSDTLTIGVEDDYYVTVSNSYGSVDSALATLRIKPHGAAPDNMTVGDEAPVAGEGFTLVGETFTIVGAGHDIWDNNDDFQYVYRELSGDGEFVARCVDLSNIDGHVWSKAGVMIRDDLTDNCLHAFQAVTTGNGVAWQGRKVAGTGTNGNSAGHAGGGNPTDSGPVWLKLTRTGNNFTSYWSRDGVDWTQTPAGGGGDPIDQVQAFPMTDPVYVGLAVTSHTSGSPATGIFDNVDFFGADWKPKNPIPALRETWGPGDWIDPTVDLTISWEPSPEGPCGPGVTYDVIFGTDPAAVADVNAVAYAAGLTDTSLIVPAADLNYEDEIHWRVDVNYDGDDEMGDAWYFEAVKLIPAIFSEPNDIFVHPGDTAHFEIVVSSDTPVTYAWFKEDAGGDIPVGTGNPVILPSIGIADDGFYYCIATNDSGPVQSASARLEVAQLIGHWKLDEITEPNTVLDEVDQANWGNHDGMIIGGADLVPGVTGNPGDMALGVNLTAQLNQHVSIGAVGISGSKPRTISCWAKKAPIPLGDLPNWGNIFGFTGLTASSNLSFDFNKRGGQDQYCIHVYGWERNIAAISEDWQFLTGTYDGTTVRWYHNGVFVGQGNRGLNTSDIVHIGKRYHSDQQWRGYVDDCRIWNYVLDPIEIGVLYHEVTGETVCPINPTNDFDGDCDVDMNDFAIFMEGWMECNLVPCDRW